MSRESALNYVERIKADAAFRQQLQSAANDEARGEIIRAAGFDLDAADKATIEQALSQLSEQELKLISGSGVSWIRGEPPPGAATTPTSFA